MMNLWQTQISLTDIGTIQHTTACHISIFDKKEHNKNAPIRVRFLCFTFFAFFYFFAIIIEILKITPHEQKNNWLIFCFYETFCLKDGYIVEEVRK